MYFTRLPVSVYKSCYLSGSTRMRVIGPVMELSASILMIASTNCFSTARFVNKISGTISCSSLASFWIRASMLIPDSLRIRSEEHTSELQSRGHLVCRLLLEKKKQKNEYEKNISTSSRG